MGGSSLERIRFYNGRVMTPQKVVANGSIVIENGSIQCISEGKIPASDCIDIDVGNRYISPGFIDMHTHGGGGHDFMDGTVEAYLGAAAKHAQYGTTSMFPTTLASTNEELKKTFETYNKAKSLNKAGAQFLGIHLEGPYFSMEQRGAQDPRYIRNPKPEEYREILDWSDDIVRWSAAPELDGALEFGRYIGKRGILPAIAHSNAIYEEVQKAFDSGYTHVTHLYSGMSGVRRINAYRYAGVIESAYLIEDMTVEIIADGCHLPASLLRLIYKIKGSSKIALVTDSMRGAGMPEGESIVGSLKDGQKVIIEDGVAKLPDRTSFAGSVATADRLVRTMTTLAGVPLEEAVKMITITPAVIMGVDSAKGSLTNGKDADMVIFDDHINVHMTVIGGNIIYQR
jgi:N-acetylglucosamine-6-phosphate deacetylase